MPLEMCCNGTYTNRKCNKQFNATPQVKSSFDPFYIAEIKSPSLVNRWLLRSKAKVLLAGNGDLVDSKNDQTQELSKNNYCDKVSRMSYLFLVRASDEEFSEMVLKPLES